MARSTIAGSTTAFNLSILSLSALSLIAALAILPSPLLANDADNDPTSGTQIPAVTPTATNGVIDLAPYAGKVVYVDFWASWCVPCRASFPWMNALHAELAEEGLVIIGVNTGDSPDAASRFLEAVPADFALLEDPDGKIAKAYDLSGMPMAFIHDRSGKRVASHVGFNERTASKKADEIRQFVRSTQ